MVSLPRISLFVAIAGFSAVASAQVSVDGVFGAEWDSVSHTSVTFDENAPNGNFGSPGTTNSLAAYDIYLRADSDYVYGILVADRPTPAVLGANLYFTTNGYGLTAGSGTVGFELGNNRAFKPGVSGYYPLDPGVLSYSTANSSVIEFALPWNYFMNPSESTPNFAAITETNNKLRLNLSQSFGYSVAGGNSNYGIDQLGVVTYVPQTEAVPEPTTMAFLAMGGVALLRRRKKA